MTLILSPSLINRGVKGMDQTNLQMSPMDNFNQRQLDLKHVDQIRTDIDAQGNVSPRNQKDSYGCRASLCVSSLIQNIAVNPSSFRLERQPVRKRGICSHCRANQCNLPNLYLQSMIVASIKSLPLFLFPQILNFFLHKD